MYLVGESFAGNDCLKSGSHGHQQRLGFLLCDAFSGLLLQMTSDVVGLWVFTVFSFVFSEWNAASVMLEIRRLTEYPTFLPSKTPGLLLLFVMCFVHLYYNASWIPVHFSILFIFYSVFHSSFLFIRLPLSSVLFSSSSSSSSLTAVTSATGSHAHSSIYTITRSWIPVTNPCNNTYWYWKKYWIDIYIIHTPPIHVSKTNGTNVQLHPRFASLKIIIKTKMRHSLEEIKTNN